MDQLKTDVSFMAKSVSHKAGFSIADASIRDNEQFEL